MNQTNTDIPHITVSSIIEREGKFLVVVEEADGKVVINQPSGHVEPQESPFAATVRETLEETGWRYEPTALVGLYFYHSPEANITYQRICFMGNAIAIENQLLDSVIREVLWLSREELLARQHQLRSPLVLRCIDDYLAGQRYPLNLISII